MSLPLRTKITGLVVFAALLPVLVVFTLTQDLRKEIAAKVESELYLLAQDNIAQIAKDVFKICKTTNELVFQQVTQSLRTITILLTRSLGVTLNPSAQVSWEVLDPQTGKTTTMSLPQMEYEGQWLGQVRATNETIALVDEIVKMTGMDCSVFQRMNDKGDMLRVASSVIGSDGRRVLGVPIRARLANGTTNAAIQKVIKGETATDMTQTPGHQFIAAFLPLIDPGGYVFGMVGIGKEVDTLSYLRDTILKIRVGKSGYVWVVGAKGKQKGVYVISQDGKRDGESVLNMQDSNGKYWVQSIIEKAVAVAPGDVAFERYPWLNPGDTEARMKIAAVTYFEPWNWVIGVGTYEDDYYDAQEKVSATLHDLSSKLLPRALGILIITVLLALFVATRLTRPISRITSLAGRIAAGDFQRASENLAAFGINLKAHERDETRQLAGAFTEMTRSLNALIGQVQKSGIQVTSSATEISASAKQLEATVAEQAAATDQVTATSKEISSRSVELLKTMTNVSSSAAENASMAEKCHTGLKDMEGAMQQLMAATSTISAKLNTISEKAQNISGIVTTITKVADQTNLLSLNASIEAEKAGEYGLGFSVVAREIRRLADQTAAATLNIAQMIKEMHSAVSSGVMEMDRFVQQVRKEVEDMRGIGSHMSNIVNCVRTMFPQFEAVSKSMEEQSTGANEISEAMVQLSQTADQTRESLTEFNKATGQLKEAIQDLQKEVSRFKIDTSAVS